MIFEKQYHARRSIGVFDLKSGEHIFVGRNGKRLARRCDDPLHSYLFSHVHGVFRPVSRAAERRVEIGKYDRSGVCRCGRFFVDYLKSVNSHCAGEVALVSEIMPALV